MGESGYAVLLSREGVELYCPAPATRADRSTRPPRSFPVRWRWPTECCAARPARPSTTTTTWAGGNGQVQQARQLHEDPAGRHLLVDQRDRAEAEALVFIQGFRDRWALGMATMLVAFALWGVLLAQGLPQARSRRDAHGRAAARADGRAGTREGAGGERGALSHLLRGFAAGHGHHLAGSRAGWSSTSDSPSSWATRRTNCRRSPGSK